MKVKWWMLLVFTCFCLMTTNAEAPEKLTLKQKKQYIKTYVKELITLFPYTRKVAVYVTPIVPPGFAGLCDPWGGYIQLEMEFVKEATLQQIKSLVFHEWGHCGLDLAHTSPKKKSLMVSGSYLIPVTKKAIQELKDRHKATCQGKLPGVYSQVAPKVKYKHISCKRRGL